MSGIMSSSDWAKYTEAVNQFSTSVANQPIVWHRLNNGLDRYGEGSKSFTDVDLLGLIAYNVFRTWPVDKPTSSGAIDKEYCHIYLNKAYLESIGYLTTSGLFEFDPEFDRFTVNGLKYKPAGDTEAAQANDNPLFYIVILQREETHTGQNPRP